MLKSTFIIKDQKLVLKTYNRELIVEAEPNIDRIWQLSLDLANLALVYKKMSVSDYDYIWCNTTERKMLFLLAQGKSKSIVAKQCGITIRHLYRIIAGIKTKITVADPLKSPRKPKNTTLYQKVKVSVIPFSSLVTNEFDDEETEVEFGDSGEGAASVISKIENRLEDSDTYRLFDDSPRAQELMTLLVQGYSRQECADMMKVSLQEIHQKVGRIRERLKKNGKKTV